MLKFIKKVVPENIYERVRAAIIFRPEDPNNLSQVLPQREVTVDVERIKGYRYPAPGSRTGARIPTRNSEDELYDISHLKQNPDLLIQNAGYTISGTEQSITVPLEISRKPTHGKRKISLLPYDPSGLRTTKTVTWEAVDKVLASNAEPDHLPLPWWWSQREAMAAERIAKNLPPPLGMVEKRNPYLTNQVSW